MLRLTKEALLRMAERLDITTEAIVIADIGNTWRRSVYSTKFNQYTVHGDKGRYVIDSDGNIVTIMKKISEEPDITIVKTNNKLQKFVQLDNEMKEILYNIIFN